MISNEEKMLKERLRHVFNHFDIKIAEIAPTKSLQVMLGKQLRENDTTVPFRTLYAVLYAYPAIDANWLLLGEGTMLKTGNLAVPHIHNNITNAVNNSEAAGDINVGSNAIPSSIQALIDEKDARIAELQRDKQTLRAVIDALTVKPRTT